MEPLGPWSDRNGPGFFNFDPELAKKWPKMARIQSFLPFMTKLLDRFGQMMA